MLMLMLMLMLMPMPMPMLMPMLSEPNARCRNSQYDRRLPLQPPHL
jgi:hypothetical protein